MLTDSDMTLPESGSISVVMSSPSRTAMDSSLESSAIKTGPGSGSKSEESSNLDLDLDILNDTWSEPETVPDEHSDSATPSKKRKVEKEEPIESEAAPARESVVAKLSFELFLEVRVLFDVSLSFSCPQRSELSPKRKIASYCSLIDVLNLSRTNKWLHSVFLTRSASCCWNQAAQNEQADHLPRCPEDLQPLRYVSLMTDRHCEVCVVDALLSFL